jgi:hypothetical protein
MIPSEGAFYTAGLRKQRDIWKEDKSRLKGCGVVCSDEMYPGADDVRSLNDAVHLGWSEPREPVVLDTHKMEELAASYMPLIEGVYGEKFGRSPVIRVVDSHGFLAALQDCDRQMNEKTGMCMMTQSAPASAVYPGLHTVLVPSHHISRIPKKGVKLSDNRFERYVDQDTYSSGFDERHSPWEKNELELMVADQLLLYLTRQIRHETGEGYIDLQRTGSARGAVYCIRACVQHALERITDSQKPGWRLYAVQMQFDSHWMDQFGAMAYLIVDALKVGKDLSDICVADMMLGDPQTGKYCVAFDPRHPVHDAKTRRFGEKLTPIDMPSN